MNSKTTLLCIIQAVRKLPQGKISSERRAHPSVSLDRLRILIRQYSAPVVTRNLRALSVATPPSSKWILPVSYNEAVMLRYRCSNAGRRGGSTIVHKYKNTELAQTCATFFFKNVIYKHKAFILCKNLRWIRQDFFCSSTVICDTVFLFSIIEPTERSLARRAKKWTTSFSWWFPLPQGMRSSVTSVI